MVKRMGSGTMGKRHRVAMKRGKGGVHGGMPEHEEMMALDSFIAKKKKKAKKGRKGGRYAKG